MKKIPSAFQRSTLWTAITALSITVLGALLVGFIYLATRVIAFLQPILIPFAVAGVLAYLLEPVVAKLAQWKMKRQHAVLLVFLTATAAFVGVLFLIVPAVEKQTGEFALALFGTVDEESKVRSEGYLQKGSKAVQTFMRERNAQLREKYGVDLMHWGSPTPVGETTPDGVELAGPLTPEEQSKREGTIGVMLPGEGDEAKYYTLQDLMSGEWLRNTLPQVGRNLWEFVRKSVGGFLGVFGFILSMVIVPLYLYYFLTEGPKIAESWSHYVPLRASEFKDEVVSTLREINGYLIAFFRGQLVVSIINGVATGLGLVIIGVKFGWFIGLLLCLLGIIPYLGIIVCWIPAVLIASLQGGSWIVSPTSPWWVLPLVVTIIFVVVQQIDGLVITPKIVGESVGLHPMTVIFSVFAWSLIMGGLLGAILAVPMTAALKVLFQRYVWQRALSSRIGEDLLDEGG
jgi:predicted PurR-regulated permease PerM